MKPHPDEVDAVKWVSLEEMDAMMEDQGKLAVFYGHTSQFDELSFWWVYFDVRTYGLQELSLRTSIYVVPIDARTALVKTTYGRRGSASLWSDLRESGGST